MGRLTRLREAVDRLVELTSGRSDDLVFKGDPHGSRVALSFDDGPSSENTPRLLDLLRGHGRATFFVVGDRIAGCEDILERLLRDGHEVGNHSYSHPHTVELKPAELELEFTRTTEALAPLRIVPALLRPPFGKDRRRVADLGRRLGLTTAMWSLDSGDTRGFDAEQIVANVLAGVEPGEIILMHDGGEERPATLEAVRLLVPGLRERGFELVTISELLAPS